MAEELKTVETMDRSPFKHMVSTIGNLPTSFVDSLSYYECLAWLCHYVETQIIPIVNNNAEAIIELQEAWIELKEFCDNYFTNLNVQNEINNKLDAMAESGELAEIINEQIFGELNDKIDALTAGRTIVRDSEYDTFADACEDCLDNKYILFLTQNNQIAATGLELPDIIGNGYTITVMNTDSSTIIPITANNKTIKNVKFVADNGYCRNCLYSIADGEISDCEFSGFFTPIRVTGTNKTSVKNCVMKNCGKAVYVKGATNVVIDNVSLINTSVQKTAITTALNSEVAGQDGVLIEDSKNVKTVNSYFEYCIERSLYSSESDDVIFSNNVMNYSRGVKFCGYEAIRKNFVCEGNILRNANDDAFCQLYEVDGCEINNNIAVNDTDSYYIGWFIRSGHNITNVNISNNYAKRIRRNFIQHVDTFPEEVTSEHYDVQDVCIENNYADRISMISGTAQAAITFEIQASEISRDNARMVIRNNTLLARQSGLDSVFAQAAWTYVFSTAVHLEKFRNVLIENNDIRGVKDADSKLPCVQLSECSNIVLHEKYNHNATIGNITYQTFAGLTGDISVNCNLNDHKDMMNLQITPNSLIGTMSLNFVNVAPYISMPSAWNVNLEALNIDEVSKLFSIDGTTYTSGARTSTSDVSTANVMCFVSDSPSAGRNLIRCRTTRTIGLNGSIAIYPS